MEDLLSYFSEVTGVDNDRALFHLDAADWDLQVALANFYECVEPSPALDELATAAAAVAVDANSETLGRDKTSEQKETESDNAPVAAAATAAAATATTAIHQRTEQAGETTHLKTTKGRSGEPINAKSNVRFGRLNQLPSRDSSSDEEGQAFYAGGSEHSGQQVLGPSKKNDIINDMFKSCQGQAINAEDRGSTQQQQQQRNRPKTFGGTGYKLGQTSSDTEVVAGGGAQNAMAGSQSSMIATQPSSLQNNTPGVIMLKLWRDGFTINDREIRSYSEPENREFLSAIKRGEIPLEIREEVQDAEVRLDMEDRRHEEYVPPKPKVKAFTGRGHKLGSPSPATVGMTVPTDPADQAANESQARASLNLDPSRSVTNIQIRLADGNSIRQQFNTNHTVGDVRQFIRTMRPQYSLQAFSLLTTYPSRELNQDDETIEQAGLQNSAIMQRLK